jgi:hypothetical protein
MVHPSSSSVHDALETYLAAPVIPSIQDPLGYWQAMATNKDPLAPMALDYISTPGQLFLNVVVRVLTLSTQPLQLMSNVLFPKGD